MSNKIIDLPAAHMGIEALTDKGQVVLQEAPEKPFTIKEYSEMFEAQGDPEKAAQLKIDAENAMTKEGEKMQEDDKKQETVLVKEGDKTKMLKTKKEEKQPIPLIPKPEDGETKEEWRVRYKENHEIAEENQRMIDSGEMKDPSNINPNADNPNAMKIAMRDKLAVSIMVVEFPLEVINELNEHIDDDIIPANVDHSKGLVGQIRQNKKSAQLTFPHKNDEVGETFSDVLVKVANQYMESVTFSNGGSVWDQSLGYDIDVDDMWTVHSYEGDYNPVHDHGTKTQIGLSCILYLKVPSQIEEMPDPSLEFGGLNNSSGAVDGFTYLTWGVNGVRDANMFRPLTEEYIKPDVGMMLMFPSWLRHGVMPFFGKGERRTFSANINVAPKKSD